LPEIETNKVDPTATSPGAILKRCREYHELTLEEAEESTKIGANYLAALEEDQISQFASLAYLKGFLRIYSTYLGLNPDDMIRLFEKLYSSAGGKNDQNSSATSAADGSSQRKKFPFQKLAMPAVILVLILITAAIINHSPSTPDRQNKPAPATTPTVASPIQQTHSSPRQPGPTRAPEEKVVEQKRDDSAQSTPVGAQKISSESSKSFVIRLKVVQSGTLTVTIDGSNSQSYDLVVGDSIEWKADKTISLELSNAGGVETELNGRQLKPFGQPGKPATVVLDTDGVKQ
jgi:cytoskeletal protein RodZ